MPRSSRRLSDRCLISQPVDHVTDGCEKLVIAIVFHLNGAGPAIYHNLSHAVQPAAKVFYSD